tara:strand:+ start:53 stop:328 length:276 start_codon:yes stop_codon:yes gene_type:complete
MVFNPKTGELFEPNELQFTMNGTMLQITLPGMGTTQRVEEKPKPKKKRLNKYQRFSKNFQYRKKKRNEKSADYIAARARAVGRAWRREQRK